MPPKPRPIRKSSTTSNNASTSAAPAKNVINPALSSSMPPPPDPIAPQGILEAEVMALSSCLQNAVVKTGQLYGFYTDVKRLGIQQYAPRPPRSLTSALGREVVQYDQLCDAMESHLLRAITVLQRDLAREEQRLKAEEDAAAAAAAARALSSSSAPGASTTPPGSPTPSTQTDNPHEGNHRPRMSLLAARRQSTISLSALSRPTFPHKLDLTASALRIHPDEMNPSGRSSPVTLAPRSARASVPPEVYMAAMTDSGNRQVDIDLTLDGDIDMADPGGSGGQHGGMGPLDPSLGSSADKPIELDLDMDMDFFGNASQAGVASANTNMFGPDSNGRQLIKPKEEQVDMDLLDALQSVQPSGDGEDIFASLGDSSTDIPPSGATPALTELQKGTAAAPSPGTILAGLAAGTSHSGDTGTASTSGDPAQNFEFDISTLGSNFFTEHTEGNGMDMIGMEEIFNMGVNPSNTNTDIVSGSGGGAS